MVYRGRGHLPGVDRVGVLERQGPACTSALWCDPGRFAGRSRSPSTLAHAAGRPAHTGPRAAGVAAELAPAVEVVEQLEEQRASAEPHQRTGGRQRWAVCWRLER